MRAKNRIKKSNTQMTISNNMGSISPNNKPANEAEKRKEEERKFQNYQQIIQNKLISKISAINNKNMLNLG